MQIIGTDGVFDMQYRYTVVYFYTLYGYYNITVFLQDIGNSELQDEEKLSKHFTSCFLFKQTTVNLKFNPFHYKIIIIYKLRSVRW